MASQVPEPVLDYLASQRTLTLATASLDGTPHASTFMYVNDGLSIYLWARPTSTTARQIQANPRVSFAIDEYVEDWNKAKGIQGDGDQILPGQVTPFFRPSLFRQVPPGWQAFAAPPLLVAGRGQGGPRKHGNRGHPQAPVRIQGRLRITWRKELTRPFCSTRNFPANTSV